jgi:hypothetical protein
LILGTFTKNVLTHSNFGSLQTIMDTVLGDLHVFLCVKATGWRFPAWGIPACLGYHGFLGNSHMRNPSQSCTYVGEFLWWHDHSGRHVPESHPHKRHCPQMSVQPFTEAKGQIVVNVPELLCCVYVSELVLCNFFWNCYFSVCLKWQCLFCTLSSRNLSAARINFRYDLISICHQWNG